MAKMAEEREKVDVSMTPVQQARGVTIEDDSCINSALRDIALEFKELRKEVRNIRSAQGQAHGTEEGGTRTDVEERKPAGACATSGTPASTWSEIVKRRKRRKPPPPSSCRR